MEKCIKATITQINPRNEMKSTRTGYGVDIAEARKMAIAGRQTWTIVTETYEGDERLTAEEIEADRIANIDPEADAIWAEMHYGR